MTLLKTTINNIKTIQKQHNKAVTSKLQGCGSLIDILSDYMAIKNTCTPEKLKKAAIITCADHGVAALNVSAYPQKATMDMTRNYLISKGAVANAMTNFSCADMSVVDMGIAGDMSDVPNLLNKKIALGTNNFTTGPAMTHEQAIQALETGITMAEEAIANGYNCFLLGEMGIGNTTASAAIASCICNISPEKATGRGTNISDKRLENKIAIVKKALAINAPDSNDGIDILSKIGGFEFGCLAGIILGAASHSCLVILDGFNTAAAALIAQALCPASTHYLMPSHLAGEPAHKASLQKLGLEPYIDLKLQLSETAGSSVIARFIDLAIDLFTQDQPINIDSDYQNNKLASNNITLNESIMEICQKRLDNLTKPVNSLGKFEEIALYLSGALDKVQPTFADVETNKIKLLPYILNISHCLKKTIENISIAEQVGLILIDGSLHMLNDMKTFAEAAVAIANDGPGAQKQNYN